MRHLLSRRNAALVLVLIASAAFASAGDAFADDANAKPRLLVLTDIGGDPDDQQSLIRLLHYANEFDIEGLIASASGTRGELDEATTRPDLIRQIVEAYGKVQPNLAKHAAGYPSAEHLLSKIKSGNPQREWSAVGPGKDTEGSNWIVERVHADDDRPLNVVIWGGQTDLAQALWQEKQAHDDEGLARFASKLRIYDINDQDGIAEHISQVFPGLFYILASAEKGRDKREGAYRGMYLGGDESLVSREWMETNIRANHGPLGALYPPNTWTAPNPHGGIKEGDTPSWFYFHRTGLNDPAHPDWGGWGGRFQQNERGVWRDAVDTVHDTTDARAPVWRWREAYQNDFAARLDWAVTEKYEDANHPPVVILNGDGSKDVVTIENRADTRIRLSAIGTSDPDGDELSYLWFAYPEPGAYRGPLHELPSREGFVNFDESAFGEARELHVILEVRDSGTPPLIRHRRAVVKLRG